MVTLKDIAKEACVSVMTVSNVVNGNLSKVSEETAERIREIIRARGYVPNSSARSLKSGSNIIAIILRGGENENTLESPHNATLVGSIIQKLRKHGYYTMVNIMKSREDISLSLRTWTVEGAIFLGMFDDEIEALCSVSAIPMVFVDSYSNVRRISNIGIDDYKGGQLAAAHLLENGHKDFAFVSPTIPDTGVVRQRYAGFRDELERSGITLRRENLFTLKSDVCPDAILKLGMEMSTHRAEFTAVFVTSDQIASYLIQGLRSGGAHIPEDISVIGFDDLMICRQMSPQLTTIAQDLEQKALCAVEILLRRLQAPAAPVESLVLDVKLVARESVVRRETRK